MRILIKITLYRGILKEYNASYQRESIRRSILRINWKKTFITSVRESRFKVPSDVARSPLVFFRT